MNFDLMNSLASSLPTGIALPDLPDCRKSFAALQEKFRPEKCKESLENITFQNKVALRRSLKTEGSPLGNCINTELDFRPINQEYSGPKLELSQKIDEKFVHKMRCWFKEDNKLPPQVLYRVLQEVELALRELKYSLEEVFLREDQSLNICGDIHGQYEDLLNIFFLKGEPSDSNLFLFNGDIVDKGPKSLECIVLLLAMKACNPDIVFVNRGNHEAAGMNMKDGFYRELMEKYNDEFLFDYFQELFSLLPAACLVSRKVLVLHGGLSAVRDLNLDDIRRIPRGNGFQPDDSDLLCDLLWSDPMQVGSGIESNSRGGGIMFGADVTATFLNRNNLQCIVRSHTEIKEGCICLHPGCYTVFSAPNKLKGVLGGVLTLHPTEESDLLRMEGFVFQQVTVVPPLASEEETAD